MDQLLETPSHIADLLDEIIAELVDIRQDNACNLLLSLDRKLHRLMCATVQAKLSSLEFRLLVLRDAINGWSADGTAALSDQGSPA